MPGFSASPGWPELNAGSRVIDALRRRLGALREGAGPDVGIHLDLDLDFNFKTEGCLAGMGGGARRGGDPRPSAFPAALTPTAALTGRPARLQ